MMKYYTRKVICNFYKKINILNGIKYRHLSTLTNKEIREKRNKIFEKEKTRQKVLTTRIEKIEVNYVGVPEECTLLMNKNLSTPYDCSLHINEMIKLRSVLPLVNNSPWDMYKPLEDNCTLDFLHFKVEDPREANKAFWRSCSFMLGMIIESAFKDDVYVQLHSWPKPNIRSGSFVYDVNMNIDNWQPRIDELRTLKGMLQKLAMRDVKFERLELPLSIAEEMFEDNRFKLQQLLNIAKHSKDGNSITVYRLEDHIDISFGPMISTTKHLGFADVASVHQLDTSEGLIYRFQGVAIPQQLSFSSFAFKILTDRARKLNTTGLPTPSEEIPTEDTETVQESTA